MARTVRKPKIREVPLSEVKDDLSRYLREAETQEIVITRHGTDLQHHFAGVPRIRMSHLGNTFKKCDPYRILSVASLTASH